MNTIIREYKERWNLTLKKWLETPEEVFEKSVWGIEHNGKGKTELDPYNLPQPYLGNPENCSVITLNLNPGPTSNLRNLNGGILTKQFQESENYFEYAKDFPQMKLNDYPSKFWNKQFNWINNIIDEKTNDKLPFAIEICPWHSKKWKSIKKISPELNTYIEKNVFRIINESIKHASLKVVLSVGKTYYDIFEISDMGFQKIIEITPENHEILKEIEWPKNKKGELTKRFFSIWKHTKTNIIYFNTFSFGSNTPPSKEWNEIQIYLMKNYS